MSATARPAASKRQGLQGRQVLGIFLVFFGAVFAVNGAMIYSALSTLTGLVANEPYRKGLHYNERIAADERQARLGWIGKVDLGSDGRVAIALTDSAGLPISGLKIESLLGRPTTNRHDVRLILREVGPGRYEARTAPLPTGSWLISLEARTDARVDDPVYRTRRRLWLEP
jgi:nitrogen fixation protein FixH